MAGKRFEKAHDALQQRVDRVLEKYHDRLASLGIKIETMLVYGPRNKDGIQTGPAITVRGREAYACVRITKLEERVAGRGDAIIWFDGDKYKRINVDSIDAILDHELTHLELVPDFKLDKPHSFDDAGRLMLKMRQHDFEVGWFAEVAQRHREKSIEVLQARLLIGETQARQTFFPGWEISEPSESKRKRA